MTQKSAGDPIRASDMNEVTESAGRLDRLTGANVSRTGISLPTRQRVPQIREAAIYARGCNISNATILPYAPAGVVGHINNIEEERTFAIDVPAEGDEGSFCIAANEIKPGDVGPIIIMGTCIANVKNADNDWACEIVPGQDYLLGGPDGSAQILFEENFTGSETHLALIRFGAGGGMSRLVAGSTTIPADSTKVYDGGDNWLKLSNFIRIVDGKACLNLGELYVYDDVTGIISKLDTLLSCRQDGATKYVCLKSTTRMTDGANHKRFAAKYDSTNSLWRSDGGFLD